MNDHTEIGRQNGFAFLERLTHLILHKRKIIGNPEWIAKNNPKVINFVHPDKLKVGICQAHVFYFYAHTHTHTNNIIQ